ncbi:MAG: hypothetical protein WDN02_14640 [Methylovirgula sp.]|uniref:hypothetical protein n=1 Tax=Methylovirgula sp. TaxID=1978224 RepID=UPI003075F6C2
MNKLRGLLGEPNPYFVLAVAVILPGMGHVLVGQQKRGFTMQMFMILMAMITWHLTTPAQSLVGRLAGGLFVYTVSIPEAYRLAKLRLVAAAQT